MAASQPALDAAFDHFSRWAAQFTNGTVTLIDGERLAWKRREAMADLIQNDPEQAIEMSVPFELRQSLPPPITKLLETQVDGRGDFLVAVGTDFAQGNTTVYRNVQLGGKNYQAFVYGRRLAQISQTGIPLHGISLDGKMAVSSEPLRRVSLAEAITLDKKVAKPDVICSVSGQQVSSRGQPVYAEGGGGILCFCGTDHFYLANKQWALAESGTTAAAGGETPIGNPTPTDDNWTHGIKTLLYMRVNFPDDLTEPISEADAYSTMDSVNSFYTTVSYDLTALDTTVTPVVTLPQTKAYYSADPSLLLADARATVKLAGFDTANYDRDIVAFTSVPGYTFGGLAYVGGKGVWLQSMGAGVTAHELGHNYGLWHANFWNTTTNSSMIGPGTNLEYGNIYDTMGSANAGIYQFNAAHKNKLDWLKADAIQVIATNGLYRIYPFDVPATKRVNGRSYAAVVQKDFERNYWLEFRQLFTSNPWTQNGLLLNWAPWSGSDGGTQLIDTTPGSPTASGNPCDDAAVVVGRTFNDNAAGVHITPVAHGWAGTDPWLDVQINLGVFPGNQPPEVSVETYQTNVDSGTQVYFHAMASDPDGDALAYSWTFDDQSFTTNNLPWTSKIFTTPGDHVVRCVVSDMKGGEASANTVVTVGNSGGYRVSGLVIDTNGIPLEGVLVSNGSNDIADFVGGWTDSNGRYVIVNVSGNLSLNAVQFGYAFNSATNWANPLSVTNDLTAIDFTGLPLPTVKINADTNVVAGTDVAPHYFTVTRIGDTDNDLTVPLYVSGNATLGTDYSLSPPIANNAVTIPAGTNSVTFTFQTLNNQPNQRFESVTLTLLDDTNYGSPGYALAPPASATITMTGSSAPTQPTVTLTSPTPQISENGIDSGEFVFTRFGAVPNDLLVNYSISGTAQAGADYTPMAGVVLIPAGQNSATVLLQPVDGHAVESNSTVVVSILANAAYVAGNPASATNTILNDDATTVTVFPTSEPAAKPSTPGTFTVKRDGDLSESLVVGYTAGGTAVTNLDYVALSGTVTIPAGAATATVTFGPLANAQAGPDKTVTLILTNDFNYDVGTPGSATISIEESGPPTISISAPVNSVSEQGDTFGEFIVSRTTTSGDLPVYLQISGTATPGADYLPLDNPVVIPDGSSSVELDVIPFHDLIWEQTESVILSVAGNTNYNSGPGTATVSITDDGTSTIPGIGFCFASSSAVESQSPGIAVSLSITSSLPVSVNYKVIGGTASASRYSLPSGTLVIPANSLVGFIPLQVTDDGVVEPPQTVKVVLFNPVNATLDAIKVHTYTILDDDADSVSVTATVPNASETGPVPGNFRIARTGSTNASQLVNFQITGTASAPTDYGLLGTSATIPAGAAYVDLPVMPADDHTPELSQTVVLTLINATNGTILSPNVATVTISDNDTNPLPVVSVSSTNQPDAVEGGTNGAFVFTRSGATNAALTISFTISGTAAGTRYVALPNLVTIPAGQTSVSLPVVAIDDHIVEGEQTVILAMTEAETYRTAYPSAATVTVQDNDQNVWIEASDFAASKYGPDPGQFTLSRFGATNVPVTIVYAISGTASNGVDYFEITNFAVIPAGQLTVTLPILPLHTGIPRGPLTVTLTLLTNAAYFPVAPASATVVIDDDMPGVTLSGIVTNVLEGGATNGVFRLTRTGDPQYDFTAYLAVGGTAQYSVDYAAFATNVYFSCGVTSIDLLVSTFNNGLADGDKTVTAALIPNPAYTILSPSNALITIRDAGTDTTPYVLITKPSEKTIFILQTNRGLLLQSTVITSGTNVLNWSEQNGLGDTLRFDSTNTADTAVLFTNAGVYRLRLTADDGQLEGYDEITVVVGPDQLVPTSTLDWPFDEGSGTNVHDISTLGHDGGLVGNPQWTTNGVLGGALSFSGTNDHVSQVAGGNVLNGQKAFTLSLWLRSATTNLDQGFFTASLGGGDTLSLATHAHASCGNFTNVIEATLATTKGVVHRISASNAALTNQWQNIVLTWSNNLAPELYINGSLDQPASQWTVLPGALTNCPNFIIGEGAADSPSSWKGLIDDVRLFPYVLTTDEILSLSGIAPGATNGNKSPLVDAGNSATIQIGNPLTLVGTTSDDGLPNPPDVLANTWELLYTNNVTIPDPSSLTNVLVFDDPDNYTFRLTADDSDIAIFAEVTIAAILPTRIDVFADLPDAYELGPGLGDFTVMRDLTNGPLTVYLTISGTASNSVDYLTMTNVVNFADGSNSVTLPVTPILDYAIEGDESVILTVNTNDAYYVGNGQANVTIHDSPYGLWSIQHFTIEQLTHPLISGAAADFDHDGIPNFAEYAFNLDPTVPNAGPYAWDFETDTNDNQQHLTLTYTRRLPPRDVQYGVFVSRDLLNWNTGTNYVEEFLKTNNPDGVTETVKARALTPFPSSTNLFMNIRVWLQQVPGP